MPARKGFSLVEAMLALVLASGALLAALSVVGGAARAEAHATTRATGDSLVAEVMADVLATHFEQPGQVGSFGRNASEGSVTSRSGFNDVDDFHNWTETPPRDYDGTARNDLIGWRIGVRVDRVSLANPNGGVVSYDSRVKRVTVTASYKGKVVASQSAIRTGAWDDARTGIFTAAAPVGVTADGVLVDIVDSAGNAITGLTGVVGGTVSTLGGLLGG
ncbi:MAG: hypothetical protein KF902_06935 [Phycisphaeraceae bacterium]|nr:hypothetical protein [Phycisphaeraceae bacterium]MCW5769207.1 hypothetical protein [Phycisphaeraceae bacterium]